MKWLCIAPCPRGFTRIRGDLGGWAKQMLTQTGKDISASELFSLSVFTL
jgi:hypothetical protein